jgi:hypothetical protein
MSLPVYRRFGIQDYPQAPDWLADVFSPLNVFCETTVSSLNKNLTIGQNVQGQSYSVNFTTLADYATGGFTPITFQYTSNGQPKNCILGKITRTDGENILEAVSIAGNWTLNINTSPYHVQINYVAGLQPSTKYSMNILVL